MINNVSLTECCAQVSTMQIMAKKVMKSACQPAFGTTSIIWSVDMVPFDWCTPLIISIFQSAAE